MSVCNVFKVTECPSTADASKLISQSWFRDKVFEKFKNLVAIKLEIDKKFDENDAEKPKNSDFKIRKNFLISFESKCLDHVVIYWKKSNFNDFWLLQLNMGFSCKTSSFIRDFFIDIVKEDCPAKQFSSHLTRNTNMQLVKVINANGLDLLMTTVEKQRIEIVDELLKLSVDIDHKNMKGETVADIAWAAKSFKILLKLLEANSSFPRNFDEHSVPVEIKNFLTLGKDMHKAIDDNLPDQVKNILETNKNKNLRHFYSEKNMSAVTHAINKNSISIYQMLTSYNINLGRLEKIDQSLKSLNDQTQAKMQKINSKSAQNVFDRDIMIHYINSVIPHYNQNGIMQAELIKSAYEVLYEIPKTRLILELIAVRRNFKIHFDFDHDSVNYMDPYDTDSKTEGACNLNNGYIFIGAIELFEESNKMKAIGTLAHELCHFAMEITFCNEANPYAIDDEESKAMFKRIVDTCQAINKNDQIIKSVYSDYKENEWPSELIVRAPELDVHYHENLEKLNIISVKNKELFDYFNEIVVPQMEKTRVFLDNFQNKSEKLTFDDLTDAYKAKILHSEVDFQGQKVKLNEIVEDKSSKILKKLTNDQIKYILKGKNLFKIGKVHKSKAKFYIERDFIDSQIDTNHSYVQNQRNSYVNDLKDFAKISSEAKIVKLILLSDLAGNGKTTVFEHLAQNLKEKYKSFWIAFIDLKRHITIYEEFEKNNSNSQNIDVEKVLGVLIKILELTDGFEVQIFSKFFLDNKVILLYDGVDEIVPNFKRFFINLVQNVRNCSNNQQWMSTRPVHVHDLIQSFNVNAYKLFPYDPDQEEEFIVKTLQFNHNYDNNELKIATNTIARFMSNLSIKSHDCNSPFIIDMVTKIYSEDNNALVDVNKFSLYDMIKINTKNLLSEKGKIVNHDRDKESKISIWEIHQIYALKLFFGKGFNFNLNVFSSIEENRSQPLSLLNTATNIVTGKKINVDFDKLSLFKKWKLQKHKWKPEEISRFGFLSIDHLNSDREFADFVHRTFAEFFVVNFFIQNIYEIYEDDLKDQEIELRLRLIVIVIYHVIYGRNYDFLFEHFSSFLEKHGNEVKSNFTVSEELRKVLNDDDMKMLIKVCFNPYIDPSLNFTREHDFFTKLNTFIKFFSDYKEILQIIFLRNGHLETMFQKFFSDCDILREILDIVELYQRAYGFNWYIYTGYYNQSEIVPKLLNMKFDSEEFCDKNFLEIYASETKTENDKNDLKRLYQLFIFIQNLNIDANLSMQNDVLNFFTKNMNEILSISMRSHSMIDMIFDIFEKPFMSKIRQNLITGYFEKDNIKLLTEFSKEFSTEFLKRMDYFWKKLEIFFESDKDSMSRILLSTNLNLFHPLIQIIFFDLKSVKQLFMKYCTLEEIHTRFLGIIISFGPDFSKILETSFIFEHFETFVRDFISNFNENDECQLKYFLKIQSLEGNLKGHSIFSYIEKFIKYFYEYNRLKYNKLMDNNISVAYYEFLLKMFTKVANEVNITDDEIEFLKIKIK